MSLEYGKKDYTQGHLRTLIQEKIRRGGKCREVQEELGIGSTRTIAKWGFGESTKSKSSAPINPHRKYDYKDLIKLYCIRNYLQLSLDECIDQMMETYNIEIKRSSGHYYLKQRGFFEKEKRKTKKFKEYDPGYIHVDISYGPKIGGKKQYIYVAIDRATRVIYIEIHEDKKAETAGRFLKSAIEFFPYKIEKILTDNGKEFTLKNHLGKVDLTGAFDLVCEEFDIEHRLTKARHPRTNGMVEKSNDTIKSNTVGVHEYTSKEQMENDILQFMFFYNLFRRHGGIVREKKGRTPYDALLYYYKIMPEIFKESPEEFKNKVYDLARRRKLKVPKYWNK